jgi:hypothetical protein
MPFQVHNGASTESLIQASSDTWRMYQNTGVLEMETADPFTHDSCLCSPSSSDRKLPYEAKVLCVSLLCQHLTRNPLKR